MLAAMKRKGVAIRKEQLKCGELLITAKNYLPPSASLELYPSHSAMVLL